MLNFLAFEEWQSWLECIKHVKAIPVCIWTKVDGISIFLTFLFLKVWFPLTKLELFNSAITISSVYTFYFSFIEFSPTSLFNVFHFFCWDFFFLSLISKYWDGSIHCPGLPRYSLPGWYHPEPRILNVPDILIATNVHLSFRTPWSLTPWLTSPVGWKKWISQI